MDEDTMKSVKSAFGKTMVKHEHDAEDIRGGPNGSLSLRQAQQNFQKFGAMKESFKGKVRKPHPDEL
jgi:hypothetical protein